MEDQGGVGAAKAETIGHHRRQAGMVSPLQRDRYPFRTGVEFGDVGRCADKVPLHHQQRVNSLVHPRRA